MVKKRKTKAIKRGERVKDLSVTSSQSKKIKGGPSGNPWGPRLGGASSKT